MDEQVLFLSRLEFAVLLLAKNVTEVMCFPLPDQQDVSEKQMIEAIYELVCMECLQVKENSVELTDSIEEMIEEIGAAEQYLWIEDGDLQYPQKIVYIGKKLVVLENVQEEGKAFRLFSLEKQEFWKWLEDALEIPEAVIEKKTEAEQILQYQELALAERNILKEYGKRKEFQSLSEWIDQVKGILDETVYVGIRRIEKTKENQNQSLLLCQGAAVLWFLWQKEKEDLFLEASKEEMLYIEPDSIQLRQEIAEIFWREER